MYTRASERDVAGIKSLYVLTILALKYCRVSTRHKWTGLR